jgi:hypothetical protein
MIIHISALKEAKEEGNGEITRDRRLRDLRRVKRVIRMHAQTYLSIKCVMNCFQEGDKSNRMRSDVCRLNLF